jgi:hypothetical protein
MNAAVDMGAVRALVRDFYELALELGAEDCAFVDPAGRRRELKSLAAALGLMDEDCPWKDVEPRMNTDEHGSVGACGGPSTGRNACVTLEDGGER